LSCRHSVLWRHLQKGSWCWFLQFISFHLFRNFDGRRFELGFLRSWSLCFELLQLQVLSLLLVNTLLAEAPYRTAGMRVRNGPLLGLTKSRLSFRHHFGDHLFNYFVQVLLRFSACLSTRKNFLSVLFRYAIQKVGFGRIKQKATVYRVRLRVTH